MNKKNFKTLFNVNLLYANPQYTAQLRKKGKKGKKLFRGLLNQYLLLAVVFVVAYSSMFFTVDLSNYPGYFTMYMALFALMAFAQSVSVIYNVFYESKDLEDYLPLPFKQGEVFFAKFSIVALTIFPFALPTLGIFIVTTVRAGLPLPLALLWSLFLFIVFFALIFTLYLLAVSSLTQTKIFLKHKNIFSTLMMLLSTGGMIVGILYINQSSNNYDEHGMRVLVDRPKLAPFYPFFKMATEPLGLFSILSLLFAFVLLAFLLYLIVTFIVPKFYLQSHVTVVQKRKSRKKGDKRSLSQQLFSYNVNLIKDPTLMMQFFTSSVILPICFAFPLAFSGALNLGNLSWKYAGVALMVGAMFAYLGTGNTSLVSVMISLDRENFDFIKSLPLSLKKYLQIKFWFATAFQGLLTGILMLVCGAFLKLPPLLIVTLILGNLLATLLCAWFYFYRDYRLLTLNWTNITQLFSRGGGNMVRMLTLMGGMFGGTLLTVLLGVLCTFSPILGNSLVGVTALVALSIFYFHYEKVFWKKLI